MIHIVNIILAFFVTTTDFVDCTNSGIYCLSESSTLNRNGLIILEFYASSQSLIPNLNKKYPIYLRSSNSKIQLKIIETLIGEMNLTQVILKPASELKVNDIYTLQIDNLPIYEEKPERYNSSLNKREQLTFKISDSIDTEIPTLSGIPTQKNKTLVHYGCGPARWVYFAVTGKDKSELFVRTKVKNKATGKTTIYILALENGLVKVGYGMCAGAFHFDNGENFEVSFQLFDQAGNKSIETNAISFTKPTKETNKE
jgi:hypothetical protein